MIGRDALGLAHPLYNAKTLIETTPPGWAIGCFDDPFGPVLKKLRRVLSFRKFPAVRIQAHWSNQHNIVPIAKLKKKLPTYEKLARDFPEVKVYVSHSCEYKESSQAEVRKRVDLIRNLAPSCIPVNSCMSGATMDDVITERHGDTRVKHPGDIVSTDGTNIYDIDAASYVKENAAAAICFLWGYRDNLREINDPGQQVPTPASRTASPSKQWHESVVRLGFPKGKTDHEYAKVKIYKTHSEDDQEDNPLEPDDPRENRPCLIADGKSSYAAILTLDGRSLGKLTFGGSFVSGGFRYYAGLPGGIGLYGYEIAKKAKALSGSEFVTFKVGNKIYGPVNPAFREGIFR